jgi:predicted DNA-binding protein YlxM (UPF0122 family)
MPDEAAQLEKLRSTAKNVLQSLTEIQRRRYWLYHAKGLTRGQIAEMENVSYAAIAANLVETEKNL